MLQEHGITADGRERLLLENLTEVRYLARRIHQRVPSHVSFDDLFHAGILGLIDAVDKFDPRKNASLKSYARFRIRGAILDSLRQVDWGSRTLRRWARGFERASRELTGELGHSPTVSQIASRLSLPIENLQRLLGEIRGLRLESLHVWSEDGTETEHPAVAFRPEEDPFEMTFRREVHHRLGVAQAELSEPERKVLDLYYLEELTMKEIGAILGVGESRISQIQAAALSNLRSCLVLGNPRCVA